jgi:hypothetical protein
MEPVIHAYTRFVLNIAFKSIIISKATGRIFDEKRDKFRVPENRRINKQALFNIVNVFIKSVCKSWDHSECKGAKTQLEAVCILA